MADLQDSIAKFLGSLRPHERWYVTISLFSALVVWVLGDTKWKEWPWVFQYWIEGWMIVTVLVLGFIFLQQGLIIVGKAIENIWENPGRGLWRAFMDWRAGKTGAQDGKKPQPSPRLIDEKLPDLPAQPTPEAVPVGEPEDDLERDDE